MCLGLAHFTPESVREKGPQRWAGLGGSWWEAQTKGEGGVGGACALGSPRVHPGGVQAPTSP